MDRTPVFVVAGTDPVTVNAVAAAVAVPGTVVLHHDLIEISLGWITRTVRTVRRDGAVATRVDRIELDHGCVSCALRHDLLPMLRRLHRRSTVDRIVVALDVLIEPEPLCWAIDTVDVVGVPGYLDGPAGLDVEVAAVIGCVDARTWLDDATGDHTLGELGRQLAVLDAGADPDARHDPADDPDDRTLAQVVVGHASFADALVVHGQAADSWRAAVTGAVIARMAAGVPVVIPTRQAPVDQASVNALLGAIPLGARRSRAIGAHDPLLPGQPPLDADCGVALVEFTADRPLHPGRLHDALDCLLDGVVCSRGRLWLATQPDEALWLESAGGGLRVATGGPWLAVMTDAEIDAQDPERVSMAAVRWHPEFGDRHTSIVALSYRADPDEITTTLAWARLTDAEMAVGQEVWSTWDDPFGAFHADPCAEPGPAHAADSPTPDPDEFSTREADR